MTVLEFELGFYTSTSGYFSLCSGGSSLLHKEQYQYGSYLLGINYKRPQVSDKQIRNLSSSLLSWMTTKVMDSGKRSWSVEPLHTTRKGVSWVLALLGVLLGRGLGVGSSLTGQVVVSCTSVVCLLEA